MSFITKAELLHEIWSSKLTGCEIIDPDHTRPDAIVESLSEVSGIWDKASDTGMTVRLVTRSHIPVRSGFGKGKFGNLEGRVSFEPFILYRFDRMSDGTPGEPRITVRSHYRNGQYSPEHWRLTRKMVQLLMRMVSAYARKGSWRNYSYVDEMESSALLNLSQEVLKFDENKTDNPHAYITRCMQNAFIRELRNQKKHAVLADELRMDAGLAPSYAAHDRHRAVIDK